MFGKGKKKSIACFCAVIIAAVSILNGCGAPKGEQTNLVGYEADPNLNPLGEFPVCKETVTLKIMKPQDSLVEDFYTNKYTKKIEEYGNVKLEFELVPAADMQTKLNLIMNSGSDDLPDIILHSLNWSQIVSFGKNGMIIPLNQYYENSSKFIDEGIAKVSDKETMLKKITAADGNIYSIPRFNKNLQNEFSRLLWIYKPWLDQLNLGVPETLDEYKAALQAFRDNDMNGNGDAADELPLIDDKNNWAIYCILNAFITADPYRDYLTPDNGKLSFAFMDDRWKEGLKYLNGLCADGLLTPTSFTMDTPQLKTVLSSETNKAGSFGWTSTSCLPASSVRREQFVAINPKRSDDAVENAYVYRKTPPEQMFFITKGCKNPEAAFRIGDLMCSEELALWSRYGEKGVDWEEPSADEKSMYDFLGYSAKIKPILQWGSIQNSHWIDNTPSFRGYEISAGQVAGNDASQIAKAKAFQSLDLMNDNQDRAMDALIYNAEEMEEYNDLMLVIRSYVTEKMAHFIAGNENIDMGWDAYIAELKNMDADRALKIAQTAYDRMTK